MKKILHQNSLYNCTAILEMLSVEYSASGEHSTILTSITTASFRSIFSSSRLVTYLYLQQTILDPSYLPNLIFLIFFTLFSVDIQNDDSIQPATVAFSLTLQDLVGKMERQVQ